MSRHRLAALVLALAAAAVTACTSPTAPDQLCDGGVMGGSGTYCEE